MRYFPEKIRPYTWKSKTLVIRRLTELIVGVEKGVHPKIVQERLGHSSIQITLDTYSHVAPGLQKIAADNFDQIITDSRKTELVQGSDYSDIISSR